MIFVYMYMYMYVDVCLHLFVFFIVYMYNKKCVLKIIHKVVGDMTCTSQIFQCVVHILRWVFCVDASCVYFMWILCLYIYIYRKMEYNNIYNFFVSTIAFHFFCVEGIFTQQRSKLLHYNLHFLLNFSKFCFFF